MTKRPPVPQVIFGFNHEENKVTLDRFVSYYNKCVKRFFFDFSKYSIVCHKSLEAKKATTSLGS